jgi:hypothetical protein
MTSILSLLVHSWIPVSVIEDDVAGSCKVETDSSWTRTADETQYSWIIVESFNDGLSQLCFSVAIQSHVVEFEHV